MATRLFARWRRLRRAGDLSHSCEFRSKYPLSNEAVDGNCSGFYLDLMGPVVPRDQRQPHSCTTTGSFSDAELESKSFGGVWVQRLPENGERDFVQKNQFNNGCRSHLHRHGGPKRDDLLLRDDGRKHRWQRKRLLQRSLGKNSIA